MSVSPQAKDQSTRPRCEAAHSPLPWHIETDRNEQDCIYSADHDFIAICAHQCVESLRKQMQIDAAYIVKACNQFPELLEALKLCATVVLCETIFPEGSDEAEQIHAAIQKAEVNG